VLTPAVLLHDAPCRPYTVYVRSSSPAIHDLVLFSRQLYFSHGCAIACLSAITCLVHHSLCSTLLSFCCATVMSYLNLKPLPHLQLSCNFHCCVVFSSSRRSDCHERGAMLHGLLCCVSIALSCWSDRKLMGSVYLV